MDVSSSLNGPQEFRIVKRGYDPDEVDSFLDQIALGVAELKRKLADANDAVAAAPEPADESAEEIHRALILAQRAADEELRKATEEAESIRTEARTASDAARERAETEALAGRSAVDAELAARREEGRAELEHEIRDLEQARDALAGDVVVLERHVEEQREVVQAAVGELQSLLDHPEAFRIAMASGVQTSGTTIPPPATERSDPADEEAEERREPDGSPTDASDAGADDRSSQDADSSPQTPQDLVVAARPDAPATEELSPAFPDDPASTVIPTPATEGEGTDDDEPETEADEASPSTPASGAAQIDLSDSGSLSGSRADAHAADATSAGGDPESEDAFLAELRKAMLDDEPLGPRREDDAAPLGHGPVEEPDRGRSRFGRRR